MHAEVEDRVAPGSQDAYRVQARRKVQEVQMSERHHKAIQAIADQRDALSQAIVARQYELRPDLWKPYGGSGREKSACDAGYHLTYLSEALAASSPSLSSDYVAWAKVLVAGLQFPEDVLVTILECTRDELRDELDPESSALTAEYVELRLDHLRHAPASVPTFLEQHAPLGDWRGSTSTRSRKPSGTLPANSCSTPWSRAQPSRTRASTCFNQPSTKSAGCRR